MPLTMRATGLASARQGPAELSTAASGRWAASTKSAASHHMRWFWSLYGVVGKLPSVHTNDQPATLEEAKAQLEAAWQQWLAWAKLDER